MAEGEVETFSRSGADHDVIFINVNFNVYFHDLHYFMLLLWFSLRVSVYVIHVSKHYRNELHF